MPTAFKALRQLEQKFAEMVEAIEIVRIAVRAECGTAKPAAKILKIQTIVAGFFGFELPRMLSRDRHEDVVIARQVAMTLCREFTRFRLDRIGGDFGGFDHGTVIHAARAVRDRALNDEEFAAALVIVRGLVRDAVSRQPAEGFSVSPTLGDSEPDTSRNFSRATSGKR